MKRGQTELLTSLSLVAGIVVAGYTVAAINLGEGFAIPVGVIGLIAVTIVLRGPLGKALARRLEGATASDPAALDEATMPLVAHIDELRARLGELEERVDFAERLLTRQRDAERVAGPDA